MAAYSKIGPFGGLGGHDWDDGIDNNQKIRQLIIYAKDVIDNIQFEFVSENGSSWWSTKHGTDTEDGATKHERKLDYPTEYIVTISGYHILFNGDHVIRSLKIETNKTSYGPFGIEQGTRFYTPTQKVLGFFGTSDRHLNLIGVYAEKTFETFGPLGGEEGSLWDDGVSSSIMQIVIYADDVINSIQFQYRNSDGISQWSPKHGGYGGNKYQISLDYPKEYIITMSGYYKRYGSKDVVCSLTIQTTKNRYGPFGPKEGKAFKIPTIKILGFFGKSSFCLDSIGAYTKNIFETFGPFGGEEGSLWDDGLNNTIKQLEIDHGQIIHSIRIEYDKNGISVWSEKHGESISNIKTLIKLDYPNEYIISISGHNNKFQSGAFDGYVVSSMKITTNKETYGPFGKEIGDAFSIAGGKVVGVHGKAGLFVNSIGGYVV